MLSLEEKRDPWPWAEASWIALPAMVTEWYCGRLKGKFGFGLNRLLGGGLYRLFW